MPHPLYIYSIYIKRNAKYVPASYVQIFLNLATTAKYRLTHSLLCSCIKLLNNGLTPINLPKITIQNATSYFLSL